MAYNGTYKQNERGTWYVSFYYNDFNGVRRRKKKEGFKTRREALEYERDFAKRQSGETDMPFASLVELYLADCKTRLRASTNFGKGMSIQKHVLPFFKDAQLNQITAAGVRQWQNNMMKRGYADTYLRKLNSELSAIFNYAVRYYGLRINPVRVAGTIGKKKADEMKFWTEDEFTRFHAAVSDKPTSKAIFELLFWTGMREGEMLALTLNDIDFEKKTLTINKSFSIVDKEHITAPPKTPKSNRVVAVPDFLPDAIKEYAGKLYDYEPSRRLFTVTKHYLYHEMRRGARAAGVKVIRVHDLRHSHASYLIEHGFPALVVSERLGHESVQTTPETYANLYPNKSDMVADFLQAERTKSVPKKQQPIPDAPIWIIGTRKTPKNRGKRHD